MVSQCPSMDVGCAPVDTRRFTADTRRPLEDNGPPRHPMDTRHSAVDIRRPPVVKAHPLMDTRRLPVDMRRPPVDTGRHYRDAGLPTSTLATVRIL